ncbi:MAG TPA: L,D-transpeptidase family protein [Chitinophagaceae bacterium]|nr:L,D-transpeptidase family protein [Chitinophagaceae bacterium]
MFKSFSSCSFLLLNVCLLALIACKNKQPPPVTEIVATPEKLNETATENIRKTLAYAADNKGLIGDSLRLTYYNLLQMVYEKGDYNLLWSSTEQWKPLADSLYQFVSEARNFGLFPEDYYADLLSVIRQRFEQDSLARQDRRDAALWSRADLLLTDAFMRIVHDLKLGRLPNDSISLRKDTLLTDDFYEQQLNILLKSGLLLKTLRPLEPRHEHYRVLKASIPAFLENADTRIYTHVPSPKTDSVNFAFLLQKRLYEGGYISFDSARADSSQLARAVKKFQKEIGITTDGKAGEVTLRMLNLTVREKFIRIALTLDKFKLLPEKMPERYVWVNLPSFTMRLQVKDSVRLESKIICGKPQTRTPLLNSAISELITYPQWTVPNSIIKKEILPAVKRDPGYLARKGFSLVDTGGNEVDPFSVDWTKYKQGIPYKVVQGSGDDNALGILKFNFPNKYSVYLHDTNQRYLFNQTMRSLSHGCVRVKEWEQLAYYMIRNDLLPPDSLEKPVVLPLEDSLATWLARKEKHNIPVKKRLPLFIRYNTCEANEKGIVFFDDIYGEDKRLQELYFGGK